MSANKAIRWTAYQPKSFPYLLHKRSFAGHRKWDGGRLQRPKPFSKDQNCWLRHPAINNAYKSF